jgi:hypothetical protein
MAVCAVLAGLLVTAPAASFASQSVGYPPVPRGPDNACVGLKRPSPPLTAAEMARMQAQVVSKHLADVDYGGSCPGGPSFVQLRPGREWLAHQLQDQYGSKLAIFVGLTAWHGHPGRSPVCGMLPAVTDVRHSVALALRLKGPTVVSGSDFTAVVTLTNDGSSTFATNIGQPLEAVLVRAGSRRVVGVYTEGIAGTGLLVRLAPGRSELVHVVGGTARCDGGIGSALPAGEYGVVVLVRDESADLPGESVFSAYVRSPHPLRVLSAGGR